MKSCVLFSARTGLVAMLAFTAGLLPAIGAAKEPTNTAPVLVSKSNSAPKWKNLAQLKEFAAKGDPQACFELADRLMEGTELKQDYDQARTLFLQAAKGGVADGWFRLGKIQQDGLGVAPDLGQAFTYYSEAAKRGVPEGEFNVGAMLLSGHGVVRDYVEGLAWVIVAGKTGIDPATENAVRARLAKKPADIASAEARAKEISAALEKKSLDLVPYAVLKGDSVKPLEPAVPAPPPLVTAPPAPAKIQLQLPPPPPIAPPDKP